MAALQCEICGGKLVGKPGGIFECEFCGVEYSTEWARTKIQEIKGTVKVEGTVQVAGTVKVEGSVSVDSMLQRGFIALKKQQWEEAESFFERALDIQPKCAKAYLGKLMCRTECAELSELESIYIGTPKRNFIERWTRERVLEHPLFLDVQRFADEETEQMLSRWEKKYREELAKEMEQRAKGSLLREEFRRINQTMPQLVFPAYWDASVLCPDGSVVSGSNHYGNTSKWKDMVQLLHVSIRDDELFTLGLKQDGTVMATSNLPSAFTSVKSWRYIRQLFTFGCCVFGLNEEGAVLIAGEPNDTDRVLGACDWTGIRKLVGCGKYIIGIRKDDTVLCIAEDNALQSRVSTWTQVQDIQGNDYYILCLKKDGTISSEGNLIGCAKYQKIVSQWSGVAAIYSSAYCAMGICHDGTVLCAPEKPDTILWRDVADGAVFREYPIGITADGRVLVEGLIKITNKYWLNIRGWENIQKIYATSDKIIGLCKDGTLRIEQTRRDEFTNKRIHNLRLFQSLESIEQDRETAKMERKAKVDQKRREKISALKKEKAALNSETQSLRGFFTGKRRREIEARLAEIETELKGL